MAKGNVKDIIKEGSVLSWTDKTEAGKSYNKGTMTVKKVDGPLFCSSAICRIER